MGSTARGVGAATSRKVMGRVPGQVRLAKDEARLAEYVGKGPIYRGRTVNKLQEAYAQNKRILLEGTQGAGLSLHHGQYPYVTSRETNVSGWELFRLACQLNEPTDIALTFVDYFSADNQKARRFDQLKVQTRGIIEEIQRVANAPVSLINTTFPKKNRPLDRRTLIDRRTWGKTPDK